jgi:PiT family inorganic phosphate transporter
MDTLQISQGVLVLLVALALAFDFMNGFHDAANAIATVVSTGVLKPLQAVLLAASCNFIALFIFHLKVAATIGSIVDHSVIDAYIIFGALVGAVVWNIVTWYFGIPSSSSHALIGGLVGAGLASAGPAYLRGGEIFLIVAFIVIAPVLGFVLGGLMNLLVSWIFARTRPSKVDRWFRRLQLLSSAMYSLGHGGNDAQKTIGIIWLLLIAANVPGAREQIPVWVVISCYVTIAVGTMLGGWRIVKTMGQRITKLKPVGGFCAETGGALTLFVSAALGVPVSTTHTITGAIIGVGSSRKFSAVRWGVAGNIVWAWVLTIPASALVAAIAWKLGTYIF